MENIEKINILNMIIAFLFVKFCKEDLIITEEDLEIVPKTGQLYIGKDDSEICISICSDEEYKNNCFQIKYFH